jgi:ABC-type dipeptide/oligopeptide/nickel transport system permease component
LLKYIFRRILLMIPILLGVSVIVFGIMHLTPGDPAILMLGENAPAGRTRGAARASRPRRADRTCSTDLDGPRGAARLRALDPLEPAGD